MHFITTALVAVLASASAVQSASIPVSQRQAGGLTLIQQLELAGTAVERLALIKNDTDFVYDFNTSTVGITQGMGKFHHQSDHKHFSLPY